MADAQGKGRSQSLRQEVEAWAGTGSRIAGTIIILYGVFIDRGRNPAILTTGTTLVLLKTLGLGKEKNGDG